MPHRQTAPAAASPVSFAVDVRRLPSRGFPVRIVADDEARAALAETHGLEAVDAFSADLLVERWSRDGVKVTGKVAARVVQSCVITLEPVHAVIDAPVDAVFVPEHSRLAVPHEGEVHVDPEGPDVPETFAGNEIDVGELAEEFFELAIDPYPHAPGATLGEPGSADGSEGAFATLRTLKEKR